MQRRRLIVGPVKRQQRIEHRTKQSARFRTFKGNHYTRCASDTVVPFSENSS